MHKYRINFVASHYQLITMAPDIKIGDKVTFDSDMIETFIKETTSENTEVMKYQKLVMAGIDQIGTVKVLGEPLTTVSYPDGWDMPIPTKYLVVLP